MSKDKKRIGVFDGANVLIGEKMVNADVEGVEIGDLKADGTYKYDDAIKSFIPLGHGFGKVKNGVPPISTELLLSYMIDYLAQLSPPDLPGPVIEWQEWFKADLRKREEETRRRITKR